MKKLVLVVSLLVLASLLTSCGVEIPDGVDQQWRAAFFAQVDQEFLDLLTAPFVRILAIIGMIQGTLALTRKEDAGPYTDSIVREEGLHWFFYIVAAAIIPLIWSFLSTVGKIAFPGDLALSEIAKDMGWPDPDVWWVGAALWVSIYVPVFHSVYALFLTLGYVVSLILTGMTRNSRALSVWGVSVISWLFYPSVFVFVTEHFGGIKRSGFLDLVGLKSGSNVGYGVTIFVLSLFFYIGIPLVALVFVSYSDRFRTSWGRGRDVEARARDLKSDASVLKGLWDEALVVGLAAGRASAPKPSSGESERNSSYEEGNYHERLTDSGDVVEGHYREEPPSNPPLLPPGDPDDSPSGGGNGNGGNNSGGGSAPSGESLSGDPSSEVDVEEPPLKGDDEEDFSDEEDEAVNLRDDPEEGLYTDSDNFRGPLDLPEGEDNPSDINSERVPSKESEEVKNLSTPERIALHAKTTAEKSSPYRRISKKDTKRMFTLLSAVDPRFAAASVALDALEKPTTENEEQLVSTGDEKISPIEPSE